MLQTIFAALAVSPRRHDVVQAHFAPATSCTACSDAGMPPCGKAELSPNETVCHALACAGPLFVAASTGDAEALTELISGGAASPTAIAPSGRTALDYAACNGHTHAIEQLVKLGADVQQGNSQGTETLNFASWMGNAESVKTLISMGADLEATNTNGNNATAIQEAARSCLASCQGVPASCSSHQPGVDFAATITALIDAGADIEHRQAAGLTAIGVAATCGQADHIHVLAAAGANVSPRGVPMGMSLMTFTALSASGRFMSFIKSPPTPASDIVAALEALAQVHSDWGQTPCLIPALGLVATPYECIEKLKKYGPAGDVPEVIMTKLAEIGEGS